MNGRIYDPVIGRFMSADPHIQSGDNLQSHNRYSYVLNNPLAYTDPSGYFSLKSLFRTAAAIAVAVYAPEFLGNYWAEAGAHELAYMVGQDVVLTPTGKILAGTIGGFGAGLAGSGGNFEAGLSGALTGSMFGWAGGLDPGLDRYAGHALAGCVSGSFGGGGCGRGAASAVAGKFVTNEFGKSFPATVIVGGTVSVIGGGKFANGATTAAFGYLFNECANGRCWGKDAAYSAPLAPPGVDVDDNIKDAGAASFGLKGSSWFYDEVRNKGPWDYKQLGKQYEDFGNFNYGATGAAFGYSEDTLLRMAGWAQVQARTSQPGWGVAPNKFQAYFGVGGTAPFGDQPRDQLMIKRGIEYYRAWRGN